METKKQTAVEWLVGDLNQKIDFIPMDKWDMIRDIIHQAIAMEKQGIIDAYGKDRVCVNYDGCTYMMNAEQYYNETYGKLPKD